jgi:hypothetical protein
MPGTMPSALGSVLSKPSPRARARRAAVIALDSVLVLGTGAAAGLLMSDAASANTSVPGWAAAQGPTPAGSTSPASPSESYLSGESCVSAAFCGAIGGYQDSSTDDHGYLDVLTRGQWTSVLAPLPSDADTSNPDPSFEAISCPSDGDCIAVGSYLGTSGHTKNLIETLVNGQWKPQSTALPSLGASDPAAGSKLTALWCNTDDSCVATGYYTYSSNTHGLIDTLSGGHWLAADAPAPADSTSENDIRLDSVSCLTPTNCVATGKFSNSSTYLSPELLSLKNGDWTAQDVSLPQGLYDKQSESFYYQSSCADGTCVSVGAYRNPDGNSYGLISTYSNGSWTSLDAPEPSNAGTGDNEDAGLDDIDCSTNGDCTAVGYYEDSADDIVGLVVSESGGVWTSAQAPLPAADAATNEPYAILNSVSCVTSSDCLAGGFYENSSASDTKVGLLDTESNGVWSLVTAPEPSNGAKGTAQRTQINDVSCTSRGACQAVGSFHDPANDELPLLETFTPTPGYWEVAGDGGIFSFGAAKFYGSMGGQPLNKPIVGMAPIPGDTGYWEVASDGGMFSFGGAKFYGSMGGQPLNKPIVGMAATPDGLGYWLVASDGGIFSFGDASFYGSMGGQPLNEPIVGIAATPDGHGYWEVASDGGIFSFGDASFYGSMGGQPLNEPIVGIATNVTGKGYWEVASDGGMFSFGDAQFYGSMGGQPLNEPIVGLMTTFDGAGYWELASDGGIFSFGDASFQGSMGGTPLNSAVVNGAAT